MNRNPRWRESLLRATEAERVRRHSDGLTYLQRGVDRKRELSKWSRQPSVVFTRGMSGRMEPTDG